MLPGHRLSALPSSLFMLLLALACGSCASSSRSAGGLAAFSSRATGARAVGILGLRGGAWSPDEGSSSVVEPEAESQEDGGEKDPEVVPEETAPIRGRSAPPAALILEC